MEIRCEEYKRYLKSQNYPANLVDKQLDKALEIPRSELLSKKVKTNKNVFPLVLDYNPILPDIQSIIRKDVHLLRSSPQITEIFPAKCVFPAYHRTKNLKEILAPFKFLPSSAANQTVNKGGCFKCEKIGVTCVKISFYKLLNSKAQPQVSIILSDKNCPAHPKI